MRFSRINTQAWNKFMTRNERLQDRSWQPKQSTDDNDPGINNCAEIK